MTDDAPAGAGAGAGAPAKGEGGVLRGLVDLATDWKVVVTAIAAGTSVFFSFEERGRKRLEVNQAAIGYVRQPVTLDRFWADPANTINEIQASYPQHAFCATLGVFLAESTRVEIAEASGLQPERRIAPETLNASREALIEETGRIAAELSYPLCLLTETARRTAEKSIASGGERRPAARQAEVRDECEPREAGIPDGCAAIRASTSPYWRQLASDECLLALDAYGENVCLRELATLRRANFAAQYVPTGDAAEPSARGEDAGEPEVAAREATGPDRDATPGAAPGEPPGAVSGAAPGAAPGAARPPVFAPGPAAGSEASGATGGSVALPATGEDGDARAAERPGAAAPAILGPGDACGEGSPLVFAHIKDPGNAERVEAAFGKLRAAGWDITPPDPQPGGRTSGDVRYYWPEQEACAAALARDVPLALDAGSGGTLKTISLAGTYKGLPRGRMELWLPAL